MIAPHVVSHVTPTPYDFTGRTSPEIIDAVPTPAQARVWAEDQAMRRVVTVASLHRYYSIGLRAIPLPVLARITEV